MAALRCVLIADDDRDWTDTLAYILRGAGYTVHTAYDGREAIEAAWKALPDFVLLDIGMPKLTGYEAARVFNRHPSTTRPVLIAITGWGRESDKLRAQLSGFDFHFTKPVAPEAILKLLESLQDKLPAEPSKPRR
jgi:CheY-like chemotaxis protein